MIRKERRNYERGRKGKRSGTGRRRCGWEEKKIEEVTLSPLFDGDLDREGDREIENRAREKVNQIKCSYKRTAIACVRTFINVNADI